MNEKNAHLRHVCDCELPSRHCDCGTTFLPDSGTDFVSTDSEIGCETCCRRLGAYVARDPSPAPDHDVRTSRHGTTGTPFRHDREMELRGVRSGDGPATTGYTVDRDGQPDDLPNNNNQI